MKFSPRQTGTSEEKCAKYKTQYHYRFSGPTRQRRVTDGGEGVVVNATPVSESLNAVQYINTQPKATSQILVSAKQSNQTKYLSLEGQKKERS